MSYLRNGLPFLLHLLITKKFRGTFYSYIHRILQIDIMASGGESYGAIKGIL